jgi:hypothetical protein
MTGHDPRMTADLPELSGTAWPRKADITNSTSVAPAWGVLPVPHVGGMRPKQTMPAREGARLWIPSAAPTRMSRLWPRSPLLKAFQRCAHVAFAHFVGPAPRWKAQRFMSSRSASWTARGAAHAFTASVSLPGRVAWLDVDGKICKRVRQLYRSIFSLVSRCVSASVLDLPSLKIFEVDT